MKRLIDNEIHAKYNDPAFVGMWTRAFVRIYFSRGVRRNG